jgi:hypothetical protein
MVRVYTQNDLACPTGVEPVTYGLEGRCSIQLSYGQNTSLAYFNRQGLQFWAFFGAFN